MSTCQKKEDSISGMLYAFLAYTLWSLFPIYWKSVEAFPPMFLLASRILSSFVVMVIILFATKNHKNIHVSKVNILIVFTAGIALSINWYLYIYAITNNRVIDASLAYYISPIISMSLSIIIFREKKTLLEYSAIIVAIIGIGYKTVNMGMFPVLSVGIGLSFSIYGIMKKIMPYNEIKSTTFETTVLIIPAIIYIFYSKPLNFDVKSMDWFILSLSGLITTIPLLIFSKSAKMLRLSTISFFQFMIPIIVSLLAIFLYKEPVTKETVITFSFILLSVVLYIVSIVMKMKKQ